MDLPAWWNSLVLVGATKLMDSHRLAMQPAAGPRAEAGLAVVCQPKHPTFCFLFLWRELLSQLRASAFGGRAEGVQQGYFSACPVNCTSPAVCGGSGRKVPLRKQTWQPKSIHSFQFQQLQPAAKLNSQDRRQSQCWQLTMRRCHPQLGGSASEPWSQRQSGQPGPGPGHAGVWLVCGSGARCQGGRQGSSWNPAQGLRLIASKEAFQSQHMGVVQIALSSTGVFPTSSSLQGFSLEKGR